jgi:hypothetical protein
LDGQTLKKTRYEGGCHCARVRFVVHGSLSTAAVCNCSICLKKGFIHLIVSPSDFDLVSGRESLTTYVFNTGIAKHHFCQVCGVHPFYVPRSDPNMIDVNVRCLDGVDLNTIELASFNGKSWDQAIKGSLPWR